MKKRLSACVLALALLLTCLPFSALAAGEGLPGFRRTHAYSPFSDVPGGAWYESTVRTAVEFGVIDGVGSGHYDPSGAVTVAQAIKIAACLYSIYTTGSADFGVGSPWYQPYVDYAKRYGIVTKTWPDYNKAATRLEMAEIFVSALPGEALAQRNTVVENAIPDVPTGSAGSEQVYRLYRAGILQGSDDVHSYRPNTNVSRSELSALVARLIVPDLRLSFSMSSVPALPELRAPASVSGSVTGDYKVTLTWSRVDGAAGYSICMADSLNGTYRYMPSVGDPDQTSCVISVDRAGSYYFKVAGYRSANGRTAAGDFSAPCGVAVPVPWEYSYNSARRQLKDYMGTAAASWDWGSFQYSYYDMDGNGIPEMFIRTSFYPENIAAVYTYQNGHAPALYAFDLNNLPGGAEVLWTGRLLTSGVFYYEMCRNDYDAYDNLIKQVIGGDFCRLYPGQTSLTLLESMVYDADLAGTKFYGSSTVSSRNYFAGSRSGFRAISESYFDSLFYDYYGYGYEVDVSSWTWTTF